MMIRKRFLQVALTFLTLTLPILSYAGSGKSETQDKTVTLTPKEYDAFKAYVLEMVPRLTQEQLYSLRLQIPESTIEVEARRSIEEQSRERDSYFYRTHYSVPDGDGGYLWYERSNSDGYTNPESDDYMM